MPAHGEHGYLSPEDEYAMHMEDLDGVEIKPMKYSKLIVALCLFTIIAYTSTCFFYLWNGKPLNDTLTILFFGCFGLEFASLAFIRRGELKYVEGNAANKQMPHVETKEEEKEDGEQRTDNQG